MAVVCQSSWGAILSGTIYGGGTTLSDTKVEIFQQGSTESLQSITTDSNGTYTFQVILGVYHLKISPQPNIGYSVSNIYDIPVTTESSQQDIFLIPAPNKLSGVIKDKSGHTLPGVNLLFKEQITNDEVAVVQTDINGYYSVSLANGTYRVEVESYNTNHSSLLPNYFYIRPLLSNFTVNGDANKDITLPLVTVSGKTIDNEGNIVSGVTVSVNKRLHYDYDSLLSFWSYTQLTHSVISDAEGNYSMLMLERYESLILTPLDNPNFSNTVISNLNLSGSQVTNLVVQSANTVTGIIRNDSGIPLPDVNITFIEQATGTVATNFTTDETGFFSVLLANATYNLNVSSKNKQGNQVLPNYFSIEPLLKNFIVNGDTHQDITIPLVTISGKTINTDGNPVPGVIISVNKRLDYDYDSLHSSWSITQLTNSVTSDDEGNYSMLMLKRYKSLTLSVTADSRFSNTVITGLDLSASKALDLVVQDAYGTSGVIRNRSGIPLAGLEVTFIEQLTETIAATSKTDENGFYSVYLANGRYKVFISYLDSNNNPLLPKYFFIKPLVKNIIITEENNLDLTIPLVTISGKTVDKNGVPVHGVSLTADERLSDEYDTETETYRYRKIITSVTSEKSGDYAMAILAGFGKFQVVPPVNSGFSTTSLINDGFESDQRLSIVLPLLDTLAPEFLIEPIVTKITDSSAIVSWQTNEPTNGQLLYKSSGSFSSTLTQAELHTSHSVLLTNLSEMTEYSVNVSVSDEKGNGPTESDIIYFRTTASPDTAAPEIISGPTLTVITHNSAVVEWETDEMATSTVNYGLAPEQDLEKVSSILTKHHRVTLLNLRSSSEFNLTVSSTDAVENGPTLSPSAFFVTLEAPDTQAPIIIAGPMVVNVSDSEATVVWETDEPAASGVSYHDGTLHGLVRDEALVTQHYVRLTNLNSATDYFYTVSSTDGLSNGPTLSIEKAFKTLSISDDLAPVIVGDIKIVGITHKSAVIHWETDEPSSGIIKYGFSEDELTMTATDDRLKSKHNCQLTTLEAGINYFLQVVSTDTSGNQSFSEVVSFLTKSNGSAKKPEFVSAPVIEEVTDSQVIIAWETDEPTESQLCYGPESEPKKFQKGKGEKKTKHKVVLSALTPESNYVFSVNITDSEGNVNSFDSSSATRASTTSFSTNAESDTVSPIISGITVSHIDESIAIVAFNTNELSTSHLKFNKVGSTDVYVTGSLDYQTHHTFALTNLTPETQYEFVLECTDISGNKTVSLAQNFTSISASITKFDATVFQKDDTLSWVINNETDVKQYRIVNKTTGEIIDTIEFDVNLNGYYLVENLQEGSQFMLVIVDKSGDEQRFTPIRSHTVEVDYYLEEGWNLIAMPGLNPDLTELREATVGNFWGWSGSHYEPVTEPTVGKAIWVFAPDKPKVLITAEFEPVKLNIGLGWNMVGPTVDMRIPSGVHTVFGWNGMYQNIANQGIILQGVGYWIFYID